MPLLPKTKSKQLLEMLSALEEQVHAMRGEIAAMHVAMELQQADDEVEALAAERVRSGAAVRTQSGVEALAELGIQAR